MWAMPMLIVNMGGEMLYILCQRLEAQSIPVEKSIRVLNDVVKTMFNQRFIDELFKPHELYTNRATRDIFDRLAHSSIMKLNKNSMDKLYDLMTMGFKYQMLRCASPDMLVRVSLNHLKNVKQMVDGEAEAAVDHAIFKVNAVYSMFTIGDFFVLRDTIARFFLDRRVKISMFLTEGFQDDDGTLRLPLSGHMPVGTDMPGKVTKYERDGTQIEYSVDLDVTKFHKLALPNPGKSVTLGSNMYAKEGGTKFIRTNKAEPKASSDADEGKDSDVGGRTSETKEDASRELNLLASLINPASPADGTPPFRLNLFPDTDLFGAAGEDAVTGAAKSVPSVSIDGKADRKSMSARMAEMGFDDDDAIPDAGVSKEDDGYDFDDILDLMDNIDDQETKA